MKPKDISYMRVASQWPELNRIAQGFSINSIPAAPRQTHLAPFSFFLSFLHKAREKEDETLDSRYDAR